MKHMEVSNLMFPAYTSSSIKTMGVTSVELNTQPGQDIQFSCLFLNNGGVVAAVTCVLQDKTVYVVNKGLTLEQVEYFLPPAL